MQKAYIRNSYLFQFHVSSVDEVQPRVGVEVCGSESTDIQRVFPERAEFFAISLEKRELEANMIPSRLINPYWSTSPPSGVWDLPGSQ